MTQISNDELDELERLALSASPAPWRRHANHFSNSIYGADGKAVAMLQMRVPRSENNTAYLHALSPDRVLALVEELRRLRSGQAIEFNGSR